MIYSILHNDLYKFSMSNYYIQNFPEASGTFSFHDRNNTEYDPEFVELLKCEFDNLKKLFLNKNEFDWAVENIPYIPRFYWEWLQSFRFDPTKIKTWIDDEKHLHIEVTDLMYKVTFYEIPILAIVSERYHYWKRHGYHTWPEVHEAMTSSLDKKIEIAKNHNLYFADFGMRRAYNDLTEDYVVKYMKENCPTFVGTSTVYLAMKYGVKPIGTMAHECFMFQAAVLSTTTKEFTEEERLDLAFGEKTDFYKMGFLIEFANFGVTKLVDLIADTTLETMENIKNFLASTVEGRNLDVDGIPDDYLLLDDGE